MLLEGEWDWSSEKSMEQTKMKINVKWEGP